MTSGLLHNYDAITALLNQLKYSLTNSLDTIVIIEILGTKKVFDGLKIYIKRDKALASYSKVF